MACQRALSPVGLVSAGVRPAVDYGGLAGVLRSAVTDKGRLLPKELKDGDARLTAQLSLLAVTGPTASPELFATDEHRLAYWYNARVCWALKLALLADCPKRLEPQEFQRRPFPLDGRMMTLEEIDGVLGAEYGWEAVVAAPGASLDRAQPIKTPVTARDVRVRINERLDQFLDDPVRLVIDIKRQKILWPGVLWGYRGELIGAHHVSYRTEGATLATAMLKHVKGSAHRRLQDAIGYTSARAPARGALGWIEKRPTVE